jgi:hypothetical protein
MLERKMLKSGASGWLPIVEINHVSVDPAVCSLCPLLLQITLLQYFVSVPVVTSVFLLSVL